MKSNLTDMHIKTDHFQQRVQDRSLELRDKVKEVELKQLEKERDNLEKQLVQKIIEFNQRVKDESVKLEEMVRVEICGLREELDHEDKERNRKDDELRRSIEHFIEQCQKFEQE